MADNQLPSGFTLDATTPTVSGLPEGFTLDQSGPSVGSDIASVAVPAATKGITALFTTVPTLADLALRGGEWAAGKMVSPETKKAMNDYLAPVHAGMPTYSNVMADREKLLGPSYEAKTEPGKIAEKAIEFAPSIASGPGSIIGKTAATVGAAVGSEGAKKAAESFDATKPYAPYAEIGGAMLGGMLPNVARGLVTPFPASAEHTQAVKTLEQAAPDLKLTAGQRTDSPFLLKQEGRNATSMGAPGWVKELPENQGKAFTGAAMAESGLPRQNATQSNLAAGINGPGGLKNQLDTAVSGAVMSPSNFQNLLRTVSRERLGLKNVTGPDATKAITDLQDQIRQGASGLSGGAPALNMLGPRYQYLRQQFQNAIDNAGSSQEKMALSRAREALDNAMYDSLPDKGAALKDLQTKYANSNIVASSHPSPEGIISPSNLRNTVASNWGNQAYNLGRGNLAPLANAGERVLKNLPEVKADPYSPLATILGALAGGGAALAHGGTGGEGTIVGSLLGAATANLAKSNPVTSRLLFSRPFQSYLGNQTWLPGTGGLSNPTDVARALLASPQVQQQLSGP